MSSLPFISRLSRDSYRTLPKRQGAGEKTKRTTFQSTPPQRPPPRSRDIQDISWLLPLTTLYHHIKEELKQEDEELWRYTHPVKRERSTRMRRFKDFSPHMPE